MAIESIDVANQINEAIAKQQKLLTKTTKELKDQLTILREIADVHEEISFGDALKNITDIGDALEQVGENARDSGDHIGETERALEKLITKESGVKSLGGSMKAGLTDQFPLMAGAASGFVSGLSSGFNLLMKGGSALIGTVASLGSGIFSLGKSIISIPFKILGGLVDMANNLPTSTAFGEAREAIRKDFGDFGEDLAGTTRKMYKSLRGELAETGLSTYRVFGDMAERLRAVHEIIKGMGPTATLFKNELRDAFSVEHIAAYQKGLGISNENMRQIGMTAKIQGKTMQSQLLEITKASTGFADAFGLSQKVIARDVSEMTADMGNFGSMTAHEMAKASTYVRKLGLEIKEVIGLIDKYDNFEDAALGAAHLAQAFGANVDALEMMKEQDPSKRLDMLRKSMSAAGVDAEKLSRQELKLLAQQTGLSEEAAKMAFSLKNQGVSMQDLEKQQKRNEKANMTQEEAMVRLSDSIERLVKSGSQSGGFLTQFLKGFEIGVKRFSEFRRVLRFIRTDLRIFRWLGIETGKMFIKFFPGVQKMLDGMLEFFNPKRFQRLKKDLGGIFTALFKGDIDLKTATEKITKRFMDFFQGSGGKKFLEGALEFGQTIVKFLAQGVVMGMKYLTKGISSLADFIENPTGFIERLKATASSTKNPIVKMFKPLFDALVDNWPALLKSFGKLWDAVKPRLVELWKKIRKPLLTAIFGTLFGPGAIQAVIGAMAGGIAKSIGKGVKKLLGFGVEEGAEGAVKTVTSRRVFEKFSEKLGKNFMAKGTKFLKVAGPAGMIVGAALGVSEGLDMFYDKIDPKFDETTKKMAASATGMIHGFTLGLLPEDLEVAIANAFASITDMVFGGLESAFGSKFVENMKEYLSPVIDFWQGLGDTIMALITGDEEKFDKAFEQMFMALGSAAINGLKFMVMNFVPTLIKLAVKAVGMVGSGLTKAVRMLWDKVGDIVQNAVTAVFGEKVGRAVGLVFDTVSKVYETLRTFVFETVPKVFTNLLDWFSDFSNDVWDAMTGEISWSRVSGHFMKLGEAITGPFNDMWTNVKEIWKGMGDDFMKSWNDVVEWFEGVVNRVGAAVDRMATYIKKPGELLNDAADLGSSIGTSLSNGWSYVTGGASDNKLGIGMIDSVIDSAKARDVEKGPELAWTFNDVMDSVVKAMHDPNAVVDKMKKGMMNANFAAEAEKLSKGGLSIEDMSLYKNIKGLDPAEVKTHIDKFRKQIVPLFVGGEGVKPEDSLMGQIRELGTSITADDKVAIGKVSMISGVAGKLAELSEAANKIASLSRDINLGDVMMGVRNARFVVDEMMSGTVKIASSISDEDIIGLSMSQARIKTVAEAVEELVRQVNSVDNELKDVETGPIHVKLKNLAKSLGVKNEKFRISHDKVEIKIHLDINMDAEQIAYQVEKGKWFLLQKGPKGPPSRRVR